MKQVIAALLGTFLCAVNFVIADEEDDRMRELEQVTVATNEVDKASNSELLQGFTKTAEHKNREKRRQDLDAMKDQETLNQKQLSSVTQEDRARSTRDAGGAEAQKIQQDQVRSQVQREQNGSAGEAFKNSLEYWTEEGMYNAGFEGGHAAGEKAFGESERSKRFAPHHGRRDREGGSE